MSARCSECVGDNPFAPKFAFVSQYSPITVYISCEAHKLAVGRNSLEIGPYTEEQFRIYAELTVNGEKLIRFRELADRVPDKIVQETVAISKKPSSFVRFQAVVNPQCFLQYKFKDRALEMILMGGLRFPNEFMGEEKAAKVLGNFLSKRVSPNLICKAFSRWPKPQDKFQVLQKLAKNPYSPFERRLLLEMLFPTYANISINTSRTEAMKVIETMKDKSLKRLMLSYVVYLERLYVLRATEIATVTRRLPNGLRRYIVETFFIIELS